MKIWLAFSAVLAALFGLALLSASASFYAPMGLAVLNWLSRSLTGPAVRPVLAGNLVVPTQNAAAVVVHTVLGVVFAFFLLRAR